MWQSLFDELRETGNFVVIAIALDDAEAARPWIKAAAPGYPCLIDRTHLVAELYGLVNVPQAVWIDEEGLMVRPPETAGSTDGFRVMDRNTGVMPETALAERQRVKAAYFDALRDWVQHGKTSRYALDTAQAARRLPAAEAAVAQAHAHFRLGRWLLAHGQVDEASQQMAEASCLHPQSWAMWRQAAQKNERGLAAGAAFWARVDSLGAQPYYPPARL